MDRRRFLQGFTASAGSVICSSSEDAVLAGSPSAARSDLGLQQTSATSPVPEGYAFLSAFQFGGESWKAYEDFRTRDGSLLLISARNKTKLLAKTAEATSAEGVRPYLGLTLDQIVGSLPDLLARNVLQQGGDPSPEVVKTAVPPWDPPAQRTFIGTRECWDTQPVYYGGVTETFNPRQHIPALDSTVAQKRVLDGLVGGWLPVIRKVFPRVDGDYSEIIVFPDVRRRERFIVHSWFRVTHVDGGKISKVVYRHTYPPCPPHRPEPKSEEFYEALLACAEYWEGLLRDFAPATLPQQDWIDMSKHSFVKETMARPGGVYPKYGAVERVYAGSEHDGFPDTFTNAVYVNLDWGRFDTARSFIENYFGEFVEPNGVINYRGPETGQYGLMLALLARYFNYTRDHGLLLKHQSKLQAIAGLLVESHEESLRLPQEDPGFGLVHGWSEADSSLTPDPSRHWRPYFGNSALAARGFKDLGLAWQQIAKKTGAPKLEKQGRDLVRRGAALRETLVKRLETSIRMDMDPPYVGPLPGMKRTVEEEVREDPNGPLSVSMRAYVELLLADVLPARLAHLVVDCQRAYGGTTLGIPGGHEAKNRRLFGFCSYGYAQSLLRLDRIEEYLLFLYAHRYHCHTRGHWTAAESAVIANCSRAPFCTPAQQVIPLLIRWMLALEDSDEERLYLGRALPRAWVISGQEISIRQAPTRWGRVDFSLKANPAKKIVVGRVEIASPGAPKELHLKLRLPLEHLPRMVEVNGRISDLAGSRRDTVVIDTARERSFEVVVHHR